MTRVWGFGQTGPRGGEPGFGSIGEAMGGLRELTGSPDRPPARAAVSMGDQISGLFAAFGTLAALASGGARRLGTGRRRRSVRGGVRADGVAGRRLRADRRRSGALRWHAAGRRAVERVSDRRRPDGDGRGQRRRDLHPARRGNGSARARHRPALRDARRAREPDGRGRRARRGVDAARSTSTRSTRRSRRPRCRTA